MPQPLDHHRGVAPPSPPLPPQTPSKPNPNFLSLILKAIIMVFLTSFFFLLLPLASCLLLLPLILRHHRRGRRHHHHSPSSGLSTKQLKKLPQFRFSKEITATHLGSDCAICLDGYRQGQWCRNIVGCGHVFHRKCVDAWLMKVAACPICRRKVCFDEKGSWGLGTKTEFRVF